MPIWKSNDGDLRIADFGDDFVAVNLFTEECVLGLILQREEVERLCSALAEWCGMPLFHKINQFNELTNGGEDDDPSNDSVSP